MSDDHDWFAPKRYGYGAGPSDHLAGLGASRSAISLDRARDLPHRYSWIGYASIVAMRRRCSSSSARARPGAAGAGGGGRRTDDRDVDCSRGSQCGDDGAGSARSARRHTARRRKERARRADHSRLGPNRPGRQQPDRLDRRPLRLLAEALASKGVSSVRIDKRGMFGSKAAVADANKVTIARLCDRHPQMGAAIRERRPARNASGCSGTAKARWSRWRPPKSPTEFAASSSSPAPGRKLGDVIREQLRANPANAPVLDRP